MTDTALNLITDALKDLGVLQPGETPDDSDAQDALRAINDMVGGWSLERLLLYAQTVVTHTLVAGTASYTIGPSGADITATRPIRIVQAVIRDGNTLDHPLDVISYARYEQLPDKTTTTERPKTLAYNPTDPSGTIYLYFAPGAAYSLRLLVEQQLTAFADLSTTFAFPVGYRYALRKNAAITLAPLFGADPSTDLRLEARVAKNRIKQRNNAAQPRDVVWDVALMAAAGGGTYDIYTDS